MQSCATSTAPEPDWMRATAFSSSTRARARATAPDKSRVRSSQARASLGFTRAGGLLALATRRTAKTSASARAGTRSIRAKSTRGASGSVVRASRSASTAETPVRAFCRATRAEPFQTTTAGAGRARARGKKRSYAASAPVASTTRDGGEGRAGAGAEGRASGGWDGWATGAVRRGAMGGATPFPMVNDRAWGARKPGTGAKKSFCKVHTRHSTIPTSPRRATGRHSTIPTSPRRATGRHSTLPTSPRRATGRHSTLPTSSRRRTKENHPETSAPGPRCTPHTTKPDPQGRGEGREGCIASTECRSNGATAPRAQTHRGKTFSWRRELNFPQRSLGVVAKTRSPSARHAFDRDGSGHRAHEVSS